MNLYVVTGLMPAKGIPLPFISYGRSSLISLSICMGLLFNILRFAEFD
jgi:cell division protein FtsW